MPSPSDLAPGLLIASPGMKDPRFRRTVILLAESSDEGALGFVVNKTTPFTFKDISKDIGVEVVRPLASASVHYGGPVSEERGWVIFRDNTAPLDEDNPPIEVGDIIRVSPTIEVLRHFMAAPNRDAFRLMLGYTGWGPTQLQDELAEGSWIPLDLDPDFIFAVPEDDMYDAALKRLGLSPGTFIIGGAAQA